jgi:glycosyltransferase involved in cell wall biosynthesis
MPDDGGHITAADFQVLGTPCLRFDLAEGFDVREWWRLRRFVRGAQFDIVHCHGARAALWGRLAAAGPHRPRNVASVQGLSVVHYRGIRRFALMRLERTLQTATDATLCASAAEREEVIRYRLAPPGRTFTVHNGIDLERVVHSSYDRAKERSNLALRPAQPTLVTVCRLHKPRDFDTLLRAMREVLAELPATMLLVAGDGPLRPLIEDRIRDWGLTPSVRLLGVVRDIGALLAAADVYVLSTQGWEGLPLAPLEAMAMCLPVVISDVGANSEIVSDEVTGLVVPARQPGALADALLRLLRDRDGARQMGRLGHDRAVNRFSARRMAQQTMTIYDTVCRSA